MTAKIFQSRWFALLALICTAASGFLWYSNEQIGWLPLVFAGVPLLLLYLFSQANPVPNLITALFALFLLTAAVGVWAAYDSDAALVKFWIVLGSILIFYALAAQPFKNLPVVFWGLSLIGLALAGYFLLANNWTEQPADLTILNQLGLAWSDLRPEIRLPEPPENTIDGLLAVLVFFTAATGLRAARYRQVLLLLLAAAILMIEVSALLLSSSWASWGAVAVGAALWIWWLVSQRFARPPSASPAWFFQRSLIILGVAAILLMLIFPTEIFALARTVPGAGSAVSRAVLYTNAIRLIPDFWLTGGGLQSFAGLYSQYILGIPFLYFEYGHNLYLDVVMEQGLFGLAALAGIFIFSFFWLLRSYHKLPRRSTTRRIFVPAVFSALITMLVHGMLENPFYGGSATPLLFFLPGLAIAVTKPRDLTRTQTFSLLALLRRAPGAKYWGSGLVVLGVGLLLTFYRPLAGSFFANYSAVEMARIELADFPREEWSDLPLADQLAPVEPHLQKSLWYNPSQPGANYRLGLIHMYRRDYDQAVSYLSTAYEQDPARRGIRKSLGYAFVWLGKFELAYEKLGILPETEREMNSYIGWWEQQGRPDLARQAQHFIELITEWKTP